MFQFRSFFVSAFLRYSKAGKRAMSTSKEAAASASKQATNSTTARKEISSSPVVENKKRTANHPLLKPFFAAFPSFVRDTEKSPETDFRRLQEVEKWEDSSEKYKDARRMFLKALVDETKSPVHNYFFEQHEDFIEYDSDGSPRYQLDRLRALKGWDEADTLAAFYPFQLEFELEFDGKVDLFFAEYPDFPYNPRGNPMAEFRRLIEHKGWDLKDINCFGYGIEKKSDAELKVECGLAQTKFYLAFKDEFEITFGADDEDVGTWENLCIVLGVVPIPDTMWLCRKKLAPLNVNIYDLIHFTRTRKPFTFFPTLQALRDYTIEKELFFPRALAKRGPLKFLLRDILTIRQQCHMPRKTINLVRRISLPKCT